MLSTYVRGVPHARRFMAKANTATSPRIEAALEVEDEARTTKDALRRVEFIGHPLPPAWKRHCFH